MATDADVDGAHIRTLLLTLFYRYFRPLIDGGYIYIAQPPLYKIKQGKEITYVYSEEEKTKKFGKDIPMDIEIIESSEPIPEEDEPEEISAETSTGKGKKGEKEKPKKAEKMHVQRYKGLGEMNAEELWETTMDPEKRVLKQVEIKDAQEADKVFDMLMGTDVPARKSFIQSNAKLANLDI